MKNVWKENKSLIVIACLVLILVCILLYPEKDEIIQAELIVILVSITLFYAIQTQRLVKEEKRLVKEEKKKNTADFWEKRLVEFYKPFIDKLNNMKNAVYTKPINKDRIFEIYKNTTDLIWKRDYMISEKTCKKIEKLTMILFETQNYRERDSLKEFTDLEEEVRKIIVNEWNDIKNALRKIYAIEKKEGGREEAKFSEKEK